MEEVIKYTNNIASQILSKEFKPLSQLKVPKKQGVYLIKDKKVGKIIYVGKSTNLYNRIVIQHNSRKNHVAGSILRIKLNRSGITYDKIADFLQNKCLFVIEEIEDFDVCHLVEALLIAILRKQNQPLLNEMKQKI